jgi:hypothetical protein
MAVGFPTKVDYATGDVLSAGNMNDLSGTVNLLESAQYAAGKNKIINGDFGINQRGFTSTTTNQTYGFDRFLIANSDGTVTYSAQTFTPGTAPVAGYESTNFAQIVTTGQTLTNAQATLIQRIESVRTLAGQTATVSFWAKANSGTPNIIAGLIQNFGSGGSPSASVTTLGTVQAISTSWARYSFTIAVPSISGKTIGTSNDYLQLSINVSGGSATTFSAVGIQSNTFQLWGVQVEAGSSASIFTTASGNSKQGELAMCQRYFQIYGDLTVSGQFYSATSARFFHYLPVAMRTAPAITFPTGAFTNFVDAIGIGTRTPTGFSANGLTVSTVSWDATGMGATTVFAGAQYRGTNISYSVEY